MPHVVVDYSANLSAAVKEKQLLKKLHKVMLESTLFSADAVKLRSQAFEEYLLPEGKEEFLHVNAAILEGRPDDKRALLSDALFAVIQSSMPQTAQLSVNIHEMDALTYRK